MKAQSVPGPNEKPQTYETSAPITARIAWNALTARLTEPQVLDRMTRQLYLDGTNTQLQVGDAILIVGEERANFLGSEQWDFRLLETVQPDTDANRTLITFQPPLGTAQPNIVEPSQLGTRLYALRLRVPLFGHNAPDTRLFNFTGTKIGDIANIDGTWKNFNLDANPATGLTELDLDAVYPKIVVGSWVVLLSPTYSECCRVSAVNTVSRAAFSLTGKVTRITPDTLENAGQFGLRDTTVFAQSEELRILERPIRAPVYGAVVTLGQLAPDLQPGQPLAFSGKRLRVQVVPTADGLQIDSGADLVALEPGDIVQVLAPPVLTTGNAPIAPDALVAALESPTPVSITWQVRDQNGFEGTLVALSNEVALARAEPNDDVEISEIAFIADALDAVWLDAGLTTIDLAAALEHCFDRETLRINANVAPVTHGETVREVLGSGNASQPYQTLLVEAAALDARQ